MLYKIIILVLSGITLVHPLSEIIKAFTDLDYQANGGQYLSWSVDFYTKVEKGYTEGTERHEHHRTCSGSLVTPTVVISAARCFWGDEGLLQASRFAVARTYDGARDGRSWYSLDKTEIQTIAVPPTFRGRAGLYADDIAVVTLVAPLRSAVKPICVSFDEELDKQQLAEGNYGRNMGTLQHAGYGLPSPLFTALEVPYVTMQRCVNESEPFFREQLSSDKICTGFKRGPWGTPESLVCPGDHGSGLAFYSGTGHSAIPYLRGVASTPFPYPVGNNVSGCSMLRLTAYTHVASQRTFLERHVPGLEEKCWEYYEAANFECNCFCNKNKS